MSHIGSIILGQAISEVVICATVKSGAFFGLP